MTQMAKAQPATAAGWNGKFVVVSPDAGGVKRVRNVTNKLASFGLSVDLAIIHKERPRANEINEETMKLVGEVRGCVAIIVDDIVDTGGTLLKGRVCAAAAAAAAASERVGVRHQMIDWTIEKALSRRRSATRRAAQSERRSAPESGRRAGRPTARDRRRPA